MSLLGHVVLLANLPPSGICTFEAVGLPTDCSLIDEVLKRCTILRHKSFLGYIAATQDSWKVSYLLRLPFFQYLEQYFSSQKVKKNWITFINSASYERNKITFCQNFNAHVLRAVIEIECSWIYHIYQGSQSKSNQIELWNDSAAF